MDERTAPAREGFVRDEPARAQAQQPRPAPRAVPAPAAPAPEPEPEPTQEAAPSALIETWPIKVKLIRKAIIGIDRHELRELSFREPTGGDINRFGNPVRIDGNGDIVVDERKMTAMMAALSGLIPAVLDRMDPRDWNSCAYRLRGFFLPEPEAW